jgi:UPF0755 protein
MRRGRNIIVIAIAIVAFLTGYGLFSGGRAARDVEVLISQGASLSSAARSLQTAGAISSADAFLARARLFGGRAPIKPGEYKIVSGMTASAILKLLQSGKTLQRFVIVPEGRPAIMVQEQLLATPLLTGDAAVPPEGSILPDAYAYNRGEPRGAVMARMQAAMQAFLAKAWAARKPTTAVTTPEQAIILASIVEKETGRASERPLVAAVYSNRLKRAMLLQADPTTIYPVTRGKPLGRRILKSELDADNGYNTYRRVGLPVGPITNPGKAAILAVLDPALSNALYFVAQGDGSSAFADTLAQHNANVQKWYAHRRAKGDM